jgi:hypothetical protein
MMHRISDGEAHPEPGRRERQALRQRKASGAIRLGLARSRHDILKLRDPDRVRAVRKVAASFFSARAWPVVSKAKAKRPMGL